MDELKYGAIMQTLGYNNPKRYKIYLSDSIEQLENKRLIGEADSYQEACKILKREEHLAATNPYWRLLLNDKATFIDFGSWSVFAAIVPPLSMKEITGEDGAD